MNKFIQEHSSDILKNIGIACGRARSDSGLSQQNVASLFGFTQQHISKFESGKVDSAQLLFLYLTYLPNCKAIMDYIMKVYEGMMNSAKIDKSSD